MSPSRNHLSWESSAINKAALTICLVQRPSSSLESSPSIFREFEDGGHRLFIRERLVPDQIWFELKSKSGNGLDTCGHKGIASLCEDLHEVVSEVTASQVKAHDGMGQCVALIDGDIVGDTVPGIQHDAYGERG